jgi:hypothetical protein
MISGAKVVLLNDTVRTCLDHINWNRYLESTCHFIIRLFLISLKFYETKKTKSKLSSSLSVLF